MELIHVSEYVGCLVNLATVVNTAHTGESAHGKLVCYCHENRSDYKVQAHLRYACIAVPQVLQYLREFDAPAMQSCKQLPCGIGSLFFP